MEVAVGRIATEFAEGLSRAKDARRPVELRVKPPELPEQGPPQRARHGGAQGFFAAVKEIAQIAGKELVATVAGKRDLHGTPGELGKPVSGKSRAVPERLVEDAGQGGDGGHVVALHGLDELAQAVARRDRFGIGPLVDLRLIEADREAVHGLGTARAIIAVTALESTPPERNEPTGTSATSCDLTAAAKPLAQLLAPSSILPSIALGGLGSQ